MNLTINQQIKIFLVKSNRFIFGNLLKFSKWELLAVEKLIMGKEPVNVWVDMSKHKWSELR